MKKELPPTLSERLRKAIIKDLREAYDEACYESFDHHSALDTLQELGVEAMPHTEAVVKQIESMEQDSFSMLHDIWDIKKPFGLSNLER